VPKLHERLAALSSFTDALNPVLVKEARQAMRGRSFTGGFTMIQVFAVLITVLCILSDSEAENGLPLLGFLTLSLAAVLYVYLPIASFQSMAGEWDEGAIDHLALSRLCPLRVLLGKLQWAAVQGLLFVLGFLPFLVLTFLMRGVDIGTVLWQVASVFVQSVTLCAVALALGTFAERRALRPVCLMLLVFACVNALRTTGTLAFLMNETGNVGLGALALPLLMLFTGQGIVAGFAILAGVARLEHAHGNHSTALRVFTSVSLVVHVLILWLISSPGSWMPGSLLLSGGSATMPFTVIVMGSRSLLPISGPQSILLCLAIPSAFFVTERSALPVRSARGIPRNPVLAMLAAPWMPGAQRGVLFVGLHFWAASSACAFLGFRARGSSFWAFSSAYVIVAFLVIASSLMMLFRRDESRRARLRVWILLIPILGSLCVPVIGAVIPWDWAAPAVYAVATLVLPLLAWHVVRGLAEVVRCSRRNLEAALTPP